MLRIVSFIASACACACHVAPRTVEEQSSSTTTTTGGASTHEDSSDASSSGSGDASTGSVTKLDVGPDSETDGTPELPLPPPLPTTCAEAARTTTSVGCQFYPLALPQNATPSGETAFLVSNVSTSVAHVVLADADGIVAEIDVATGATERIVVGTEHELVAEASRRRHGYRLTSDAVLQVFVVVPPEPTPTADATLVLPINALGTRHRVVTYPDSVGLGVPVQYVAVVSPTDDVEVTIELVGETTATHGGNGVPALSVAEGQDRFTATLDALDVLLVPASSIDPVGGALTNDLTGTLVRSSAPVAVYSGTLPVYVPQPAPDEMWCCADLLAEAVPPTSAWGTQYAAVKYEPLGVEPDLWRFIADADDTSIELVGDVDESVSLDAGEFADVVVRGNFVATSDRPFALVHFMVSSELADRDAPEFFEIETADCGMLASPGDPAMNWVYARGNWLNRYLYTVDISEGSQWCHDHVTIVAPTHAWSEIQHDGEPLPEGEPLGDGELSWLRVSVPDGTHELLAPPEVGVQLEVYGYTSWGSYVFSGGVGVQTLNPEG